MSLVGILLQAPVSKSGVEWVGIAGLGALFVWWSVGFRRGRFPAWGLLIEGLALGAIELSSADPVRMVLLYYAGLCLRSLYATPLRIAGLVATYFGAQLGGQLLSGGDLDVVHLGFDAVGFAVFAVVLLVVGRGIAERDEVVLHEAVLACAAS